MISKSYVGVNGCTFERQLEDLLTQYRRKVAESARMDQTMHASESTLVGNIQEVEDNRDAQQQLNTYTSPEAVTIDSVAVSSRKRKRERDVIEKKKPCSNNDDAVARVEVIKESTIKMKKKIRKKWKKLAKLLLTKNSV